MKFDPNSQPPTFASDNEIIEKGSKVRIQLVGTRVEAAEMVSSSPIPMKLLLTLQFAIGTIKKDYLGLIPEE